VGRTKNDATAQPGAGAPHPKPRGSVAWTLNDAILKGSDSDSEDLTEKEVEVYAAKESKDAEESEDEVNKSRVDEAHLPLPDPWELILS